MAAQGYIGRAPGESSVIVARQTFTPTGITTNFTFASGYTVGYVDAYLNGARLIEGDDYTATDGSVVGLTTHAISGDVLELVVYKAFNVSNVVAANDDFSVGGDLSVTGNASVTGTTTLSGNITVGTGITLDTNGNVNVSGVLTANSFVGDGTQLTGVGGGSVISGITIREEGSVVGTSGTVVNVNFVGADVTATAQAGFSTITIAGGGKFINFTDGGSTGITTTAKTKIDDDFNVTGVGTFASRVSVGDSIFHVGDDNTAIGFPAADTFTVYTAGSERVRVDDNGRIIGGHTSTVGTLYKTTYQAKGVGSDHSAGYSVISGNDELAGAIVLDASANNGIRIDSDPDNARSDSYIRFRVDASEKVRIKSDGDVGIGTANPTEKLHVFNRASNGALIHYDGASNSHFGLRIRSNSDGGNFESDFGNGTTAMLDLFADAGTVSGGDFLVCRSQAAIPILLVKGNGRVGVGTAAPAGVFQIEAASTTDMIMLNAGGTNFAKLGHNSASGTDILDVRSEGHTRFLTNGNNERVRINSAGRVGIATVLPEAQLTVKGDGDIAAKDFKYLYSNTHGIQVKGNESAIDIVGSDAGSHGASLLIRSSTDGFGMHFNPARDQLVFRYTVPSADDFTIHDGSNTSTNTEVLTIGKTGICTATQFDATSDVALKENIEVIDEPIIKLSELKGVTFDWKAGGHSVGVIAQDVEKVLPTAVGGSEDRKTVNYNAIIGLLIESVKDQQKQIEELKSLLDK